MDRNSRKKHWENIYQTKSLKDVSWYQPTPQTSLDFIQWLQVPLHARIIDVGGGDSLLVDHLLERGYQNLTVLDISEAAIEKAQQRLGSRADQVKWIVADAANFVPGEKYDLWHDRATFHFLTEEREISGYLETAQQNMVPGGYMIMGTFSEQGPEKCSGITIRQYSEENLTARLNSMFEKIKCIYVDHQTPSKTLQNFVFCSFRKPRIAA